MIWIKSNENITRLLALDVKTYLWFNFIKNRIKKRIKTIIDFGIGGTVTAAGVSGTKRYKIINKNKKLKLVLSFSSRSKTNHKRYQAGGLNQKNLFHLNPDKKSNHSTKGTKKDKPYTKQENMIYKHKIIIHFFILENLNFSTKSTKIDGRMI